MASIEPGGGPLPLRRWWEKPTFREQPTFAYSVLALAAVAAAIVVLINMLSGAGSSSGTVADPGWLDEAANGDVVYCSGEDVSRSQGRSIRDFNRSSEHGSATATLDDGISPKANRQREAYIKLIESSKCDVVYLDIIYTPEFASRDLLYDMSRYFKREEPTDAFDERMMKTVKHEDKLWGVPKQLDAGLLYYRRDRVRAPRTWKDLVEAAVPRPGERPGLRLQLDGYEGLTVIFLELAYAAGAAPMVSDDGKQANLSQEPMVEALKLLQTAIRRRAVPRSAIRSGDAGSYYAFSVGRASFLRAWPYVEARLRGDAAETQNETGPARRNTAANLGVTALPSWTRGSRRVGILGGHNLVIPRTAKNPEGALHLIKFLTSKSQILADAREASLAPVRPDLDDLDDVRSSPALRNVRSEDLVLRPPIVKYSEVSKVIYESLRGILTGARSDAVLRDQLKDLEEKVNEVL